MPTQKQREAAKRVKEFLAEFLQNASADVPVESAGWGNDLTVADLQTLVEAIIPPQKVYGEPLVSYDESGRPSF